MNHLPLKKCTESDEYKKSAVWIELTSEDNKRYAGAMQRCGTTPPGYPDRATYAKYPWGKLSVDDIYVYDGGYFWLAHEWREYFRKHGISPVVPAQEGGAE